MRKRPIPKATDWRDHLSRSKKPCRPVKCPKCGKPGCWSWWVDYTEKDTYGKPINRVVRVAHAHNLKDTFFDKRNYNCVLRDTKTRLKDKEGVWSFRLHKPDSIPWYVSDQF